nr:ras-like protein family member 11A isoform X2 [Pelodiscus sinensis]|eukprot:XP_006138971.1 ras-like protein family member 11A isoform X2 [Pelodiscus sinensis]
MRLPTMSNNFLLAPILECSSPCFQSRDIKLAVLGAGSVGKSAMIVRFLTKRFIGDYEPNTGNLYSRLVHVEGDQVSIQIQDTPGFIQVQEGFVQYLCKEVSKLHNHSSSGDRRRSSIIPRPKSPNMQDLKRRFKQALSSKVK